MTISTTSYVDEPIILITLQGTTDQSQLLQTHQDVITLCDDMGICYVIIDVQQAAASIHESLSVFRSDQIGTRISSGHLHIVVVSGNTDVNIPFPHMPDRDAALQRIRQQIAEY